jgi:hypothetical protein
MGRDWRSRNDGEGDRGKFRLKAKRKGSTFRFLLPIEQKTRLEEFERTGPWLFEKSVGGNDEPSIGNICKRCPSDCSSGNPQQRTEASSKSEGQRPDGDSGRAHA